ncbi:CoxG family protein [Actibacterium ureilyticum]|uniref:CoxG family protein n=1 Tax=Actibacterium ureilyticum TaxID=1590614 RepID=UPI000BAAE440|nr:carbon monoxide dehydrogenase subunit G [Actibacterium ureilyticum]
MNLEETREIKATPDAVWAGLTSAEVLAQCIPGCQELTGSVEDGFEAVVVQKVGPVKATFRGNVALSDVVAGQSCTISGEGKGGAAGFAKGGANVSLAPGPEGTRLTYVVDAKVGGKLAQLGSRIIDGFAKKMVDKFFANFQEVVEGSSSAETAPATGGEA